MKPRNPPDEDKWEALGLYDRCTCNEYDWPLIVCPYGAEIFDDCSECECCPHHAQECSWNI